MKGTLQERFDAKHGTGPGCWLWTASTNQFGYGLIGDKGKTIVAHRVSWELRNGTIPQGLFVLHKCDVRNCVNPGHLFLGTQADNMADRDAKGRGNQPKGVNHYRAKLGEPEVLEIRRRYALGKITQAKLAIEFGVSQRLVGFIINRQRWAHI